MQDLKRRRLGARSHIYIHVYMYLKFKPAITNSMNRTQSAQFHATKLLRNGVPLILVQLAILIILAGYLDNAPQALFDVIEYFSGMEANKKLYF